MPSFGAGAELALVMTTPGNGYFIVTDNQFNVLADVSNILTFTPGNNLVFSGKTSDVTGLASPTLKGTELVTISYDNTGGQGQNSIQFTMQGMLSGSITDSFSGGATTELQTGTMTSGTGEGSYNGIPLVMTGSMALRGKAKY